MMPPWEAVIVSGSSPSSRMSHPRTTPDSGFNLGANRSGKTAGGYDLVDHRVSSGQSSQILFNASSQGVAVGSS
jgi:hypothetical protein